MISRTDYSLKTYNTFNIETKTKYFAEISQLSDLLEFSDSGLNKVQPRLILGGGSNILFTSDFNGVVIHSCIFDLEILEEDSHSVTIKAGSGITWDDLVGYCVEKEWGGIENLSDIPGSVGAAPVQNIGAYGVEAKDCIVKVEAFDLKTRAVVSFNNKDCRFGYRYSVFKEPEHKDLFITHVHFKLLKNPDINTSYGRVQEELKKHGEPTISNLREVIKNIRASKLPSTDELGSAGSFFKNPVVSLSQFTHMQNANTEMPFYKVDKEHYKIPAAWLIEHSGMKGYRLGDVGTYQHQPLVIVNYGNATGKDIVELSELIRKKVFDKFNLKLEPEVCFV